MKNKKSRLAKSAGKFFSAAAGATAFILEVINAAIEIPIFVKIPAAFGMGIIFGGIGAWSKNKKLHIEEEKELAITSNQESLLSRVDEIKITIDNLEYEETQIGQILQTTAQEQTKTYEIAKDLESDIAVRKQHQEVLNGKSDQILQVTQYTHETILEMRSEEARLKNTSEKTLSQQDQLQQSMQEVRKDLQILKLSDSRHEHSIQQEQQNQTALLELTQRVRDDLQASDHKLNQHQVAALQSTSKLTSELDNIKRMLDRLLRQRMQNSASIESFVSSQRSSPTASINEPGARSMNTESPSAPAISRHSISMDNPSTSPIRSNSMENSSFPATRSKSVDNATISSSPLIRPETIGLTTFGQSLRGSIDRIIVDVPSINPNELEEVSNSGPESSIRKLSI